MTGSQYNYDFASYLRSDWTLELDDRNTESIVNQVLQIAFAGGLAQNLSLYQSNPPFNFSNGFIVCASVKSVNGEQTWCGPYVKVGTEWHYASTFDPTPTGTVRPGRALDLVARPNGPTGLATVPTEIATPGVWKWIGLRFNLGGDISVVYNLSTNHKVIPKANEWTVAGTFGSWSGSDVLEIGFMGLNSFDAEWTRFISKMALTTLDYDGKLAPTGLDADVTAAITSYYFRNALNGGGNAAFSIVNPFETEISTGTIKTQLKKEVLFNNTYQNQAFRGEVSNVNINMHHVLFEAEEATRKTQYTLVDASPIIHSTLLKFWTGRNIFDVDGYFVDNGVTDARLLAFEKSNPKRFAARPISASVATVQDDFSTPYVPDDINNNTDSFYWFDPLTTDTLNGFVAHDDSQAEAGQEKFATKLPVFLYEKFENVITNLEVIVKISTPSQFYWHEKGDSGKVRLRIYDNYDTTWLVVKEISINDISSAQNTSDYTGWLRSDVMDFVFDIDTEIIANKNWDASNNWAAGSTYAINDEVAHKGRIYRSLQNANTDNDPDEGGNAQDGWVWWYPKLYDFVTYETIAADASKFSRLECLTLIQAGKHSVDTLWENHSSPNGYYIWEYLVGAFFEEDNHSLLGSCEISFVSQVLITSSVNAGIDLPAQDGFGVDDLIYVTKTAEDYIIDTWAASPINSLATLDFNVTGADALAITSNFINKSFFELLQTICSALKATWWYDNTNDTVVVRSVDLLDDSGVIIQAENVVGWDLGQWSINYDGTTERSSAIVVGDGVVVTGDYSPDHNFDLGAEVDIIEDSDIITSDQGTKLINSLKPIRESAGVIVKFTLDYNDTDYNYAAIQEGKLITVQWPTTGSPTIANFSGASKLMVLIMETNSNDETGYNEHVSITAQKRES